MDFTIILYYIILRYIWLIPQYVNQRQILSFDIFLFILEETVGIIDVVKTVESINRQSQATTANLSWLL